MALEDIDGQQPHPWTRITERHIRIPTHSWKQGRTWFRQPSRSPNTSNSRVREAAQVSSVPATSEFTSSATTENQHNVDHDTGPTHRYELPGNTPGTSDFWPRKTVPANNRGTSASPVELVTTEHGTYEEMKAEFRGVVRTAALRKREQQTLDYLERTQLEEPGMFRLRRVPFDTTVVELDTDTPGPAELPGSSIKADSTASTTSKSPLLPRLPNTSSDGSRCASPFQWETALYSQPEDSRKPEQPVASCTSEGCYIAGGQPSAIDEPLITQKTRLSTTDKAKESTQQSYDNQPSESTHSQRSGIYNGPSNNNTDRSVISSPIGTAVYTSRSDRPASSTSASPGDTTESYFDGLDRLIGSLPPRMSRRQLHREKQ